jgi:subtilisin family serine protease
VRNKSKPQPSIRICFSGLARPLLAVTISLSSLAAHAEMPREFVPGEILVKLKGSSKGVSSQAFVGKAVTEKSMTLKGSFSSLNLHYFALKAGQSVESALDELKADPDVQFAEPNYIFHRQSTGFEGEPVPMDEARAQAAAQASAQGSGDYSASSSISQTSAPIQLAQAWANETPGLQSPIVAVIDTGISSTHSVFTGSNAIWTNTGEIPNNGRDDDGNGYIDDVHGWNFVSNTNSPEDDDGHGTHVSGIVLGTTQDIMATPIAQAKIRIMPLKFLDANGSGTTANAVRAIYYAVNNGAKVLNNSWGGGGFSESLLQAMAYAYDKKVVFVAAAGNASNNNDASATYPANYNVPNVMSIAATSDADGMAYFSNYGRSTVHVGSPGVSIYSTFPNNSLGYASGTSMAAPFISGLAALIVRESPTMTGYQVKNLIFANSVGISALVNKTTTQARMNVYRGIMAAKSASVSADQPSYDVNSMRNPASDMDSAAAGCGLVSSLVKGGGEGGFGGGQGQSPQGNVAFFGLLIVLSAPVLFSMFLRSRNGKYQRRHERFQINSEVRVKVGDRELVGQVSTISLGGVQLNTEAWLEKGGIVAMSIRSPDGKDEVQVEGKIVWSEESKRYGVAFEGAKDTTLNSISRWTQGLLKAQ